MSPTSYQLLYPAIFLLFSECLHIITQSKRFVKCFLQFCFRYFSHENSQSNFHNGNYDESYSKRDYKVEVVWEIILSGFFSHIFFSVFDTFSCFFIIFLILTSTFSHIKRCCFLTVEVTLKIYGYFSQIFLLSRTFWYWQTENFMLSYIII